VSYGYLILELEIASQRVGFLVGFPVLVVIGVALIALALAKPVARISAAVAWARSLEEH
jgi:hypothetical protein